MRLAECAGIKVVDVDFTQEVIIVTGKGRRPRAIPFGAKTSQSLDRYMRLRSRHSQASSPALWLGPKGGADRFGDSRRSSNAGAYRRGSRRCILTSSATRPRHHWDGPGWGRVGRDAALRLEVPNHALPLRCQRR